LAEPSIEFIYSSFLNWGINFRKRIQYCSVSYITKMKRQLSLSAFFSKKTKGDPKESQPQPLESEESRATSSIEESGASTSSTPGPEERASTSSGTGRTESDIEGNLPDCWTLQQYNNFREKYDGLDISQKKIGCKHCRRFEISTKEKSVHRAKEWKNFHTEPSGRSKEIQQASLRMKLKEHFSCKQCEQDVISKGLEKMTEKYLGSTCRVFSTVYSLAQTCRPFSYIEDLIELQITNGLDLGTGLHSRKTAVAIVDFIAKDIRKHLFSKIIEKTRKICLIIDEASTISSKPVLILYLKVEDPALSPTIFLELEELDKQDAKMICCLVMESSNKVGFNRNYLEKHLIGFCSDGASVMLGRKSGVSTRIAKEFPNTIIWHCLNHCLQLVLDDSIREIKQINHFQIYIDKIYSIFHQSNKNLIEFNKNSEQLEIEIINIGRVFGPRWAACSLRSTLAVWWAYPALHQFFGSNNKYSGMAACLENSYFLTDLALMMDVLTEISLLSNALQVRNIDIIKAEKLVIRSIRSFEMLIEEKGAYENKVDELITSETFKNINFIQNHRFVELPHEKLIQSIVTNLKKRLMDCKHLKTGCQFKDTDKLKLLNYLEPDYWNMEEVVVPWRTAEEQLVAFGEIFNYEININDYRDFIENVLKDSEKYTIPCSIKQARDIIRTIAVGSAEAERGFSQMNIICSEGRSRLTVSNITNLLTTSLIALPLQEWDPVPIVKKWLQAHHTADDACVKQKKTED
uniref:Uncharacterized protein n=1 Tax=Naja naja TaxID=35670 RepID=A0A8C6XY64_NAJNA